MKRFKFRLARVLRWRSQAELERKRLHAAALAALAGAERALADHDAENERFLLAAGEMRRTASVLVEMWAADDRALDAFRSHRSGLEAAVLSATRSAELTREALVAARRELETVETLRRTWHERWQRQSDADEQKHADEMHRSRMVRARTDTGDDAEDRGPVRTKGAPR
jgi:flagellar export protein FliJ